MKSEIRPKTMPVAMTDTGLEWCGYRMFLMIPVELGAPTPDMVIPEFRKSIKMMERKTSLDDFYRMQRIVLDKILNGLSLVN